MKECSTLYRALKLVPHHPTQLSALSRTLVDLSFTHSIGCNQCIYSKPHRENEHVNIKTAEPIINDFSHPVLTSNEKEEGKCFPEKTVRFANK